MNRPYLILLGILMSWNSHALAQKIVYSAPEKKDFDRFRFDVIAHHEDKILVYKADIVLSFYSQATQGDIEGLYCVIRNAEGDNDIAVTKTILTDSVRRHIKAKGNTKFHHRV